MSNLICSEWSGEACVLLCEEIYDGLDKHMAYNNGMDVIHLKQFWIPLKGQDRSCKY